MLNRIVGLLSPFRAASGERTVNAAQWVGLALTAVAFVLNQSSGRSMVDSGLPVPKS